MSEQPEKDQHLKERDSRGRFLPGCTGNRAGKAPGTRHKATQLAEKLITDQSEALVKKAVDMALAGDQQLLKTLLERLVPKRRHAAVTVAIPEINSICDLPAAINAIIRAAASGEIPAGETGAFIQLIDGYRRSVETVEIERRLSEIEIALEKGERHGA